MTYRMPDLPIGSCKYGAPMGRRAELPDTDAPVRLRLERLAVCGDYDNGGAYWGCETPGQLLYVAHNDDTRIVVRARDRQAAAIEVRKQIPSATFRGVR